MSIKENLKKTWLKVFLVVFALQMISTIFSLLPIILSMNPEQIIPQEIAVTALPLIILLSVMFVNYWFIYKKDSLRWLMFVLFAIPLGLSKDIQSIPGEAGIFFLISLLELGLMLYYWVTCLRLYKQLRKEKELESNDNNSTDVVIDIVAVRKKWLNAFYIYTSTQLVLMISALVMYSSIYFANYSDPYEILRQKTIIMIFYTTLRAAPFIINYWFIYKKKSIFFLLLSLFTIPIPSIIAFILISYTNVPDIVQNSLIPIIFSINIYYWINCLRLFKSYRFEKKGFRIKPSIVQLTK